MPSKEHARTTSTPPPAIQMLNMTLGSMMSAHAIAAVAQLGIADSLRNGPKSATELAACCASDAGSLYRLLRAATTIGVLTENPQGAFALTALGETLRHDAPDSMRAMAILACAPWRLRAWTEMMRCIQSGDPAFRKVHGVSQYEYLARHAEDEENFAAAMTALSKQDVQAVLAAYDFSGSETVADIGGGEGTFLTGLLQAHPSMRGIVFDRPPIVERAREFLRSEGMAERLQAIAGDFLENVPSGADLYVLKNVLLDWDDEHTIKILRNCKRVMSASNRLLIVEPLIPGPEEAHLSKLLDLEMLLVPGGRARTVPEVADLLSRAGLTVTRVLATPGPASIVEGKLR